jgi:hypothetical protein
MARPSWSFLRTTVTPYRVPDRPPKEEMDREDIRQDRVCNRDAQAKSRSFTHILSQPRPPPLTKMPLEATMMIVDNSEYMRNGDYQPTRFEAQADAVNTVFRTKIDSNPENTVGIMTMAGKGYVSSSRLLKATTFLTIWI